MVKNGRWVIYELHRRASVNVISINLFFSTALFTMVVFFSVTSILVIFVNMFKKSRDENARTAELEKKKLEKDKEKATLSAKKVLE